MLSHLLMLCGLTLGLLSPLVAQERFPSRPISIVVPFPPGGVADIVARALVPSIEANLRQTVVVVNKAGAGGAIGSAVVANAKPDGYTLLMALSSVSTNPEQEVINGRPPAFLLNQLQPVARISQEDMMLAVRDESPYRSLDDLVSDVRARPGAVSYASSGVYGVYHVATEIFTDSAGLKLLHAPYAGGAPALLALLSGQVDVGLVTRSVGAAHLKSGKLRPLAAWGDSRWIDFPKVASLKEASYNAEYKLWSGLFAPAATSPEVMSVIRSAVKTAVQDPKFKETMARFGATIVYLDAPEFQRYWDADSDRVIKAVRKIGKIQ